MKETNTIATAPKKKSINTIALLFMFLVIFWVLAHLIPTGEFAREVVNGRNVVIPGSYAVTEGESSGWFDIFLAIPNGFSKGVGLICAFMVIGGAFGLLKEVGAIDAGISAMIHKVGIQRGNIILLLLFFVFSCMGAFLSMTDGAIPFIPVAISIALGLGYDPIVALGVTTLGCYSGFLAGPLNHNSVMVCQQIAGLPLYSGMGLRLVLWVALMAVTLWYVLRYAKKVRKNYNYSLVADAELDDLKFDVSKQDAPFTLKQKLSLLSLLCAMISIVVGSAKFHWGMTQITASYCVMIIVVGIINRMDVDHLVKTFTKGAAKMINSVWILTIAYGISWLLTDAKILDTIVYWVSTPLTYVSSKFAVVVMTLVVSVINFFITSASGKAAILMPIIQPLGDLIGIEAQVSILCYQVGDVVTNMITPLSGFLMTCLGFARVPYQKWLKFALPLAIIWLVIGVATMFVGVAIGYC